MKAKQSEMCSAYEEKKDGLRDTYVYKSVFQDKQRRF